MPTTPPQLTKLVDTLNDLAEKQRQTLLKSAELNHRLREREADRLTLLAEFSHELKKPLSVIRALTCKITDPRLAGQLDNEVERAVRMLDGLITLGQLQIQKTSPPQELQLSALAQQIFEGLRGRFPQHLWQADIAPNLRLWSAPETVFAILENLLENAAKYTAAGGRVALAVQRRGSEAVIAVADSGRGLSAKEQKRVLAPFARVAHDTAGSGLGLSIVQQAVKNLGGELQIVSAPNVGSTFTVRLPLPATAAKSTKLGGRAAD